MIFSLAPCGSVIKCRASMNCPTIWDCERLRLQAYYKCKSSWKPQTNCRLIYQSLLGHAMQANETQRLLKWVERVALDATYKALEAPRIEDRSKIIKLPTERNKTP